MRSKRTLVVLVVVDVILVVLLVVVALTRGGGSGSDGSASTPGGTAGAPGSSASSSATSTKPVTFQLPSGNIACVMSVDGVTCTIASYTYAPPVVAGCAEVTGHVIVLNADGATFDCVSGPPPAVAGEDVPVLEYGSASSVGDYTCTSGTDGVQCVNGSGTGFRLARAAWSNLP